MGSNPIEVSNNHFINNLKTNTMSKLIMVSAYRFKTKEEAASKVNSILSHRKGRIEEINKPLIPFKSAVDIATKALDDAEAKLKTAVFNNTDDIKALKKEANRLKIVLDTETTIYNTQALKVRKVRSNYRHSNKYTYCDYDLVGKKGGKWVFKSKI